MREKMESVIINCGCLHGEPFRGRGPSPLGEKGSAGVALICTSLHVCDYCNQPVGSEGHLRQLEVSGGTSSSASRRGTQSSSCHFVRLATLDSHFKSLSLLYRVC